MFEGLHRGEGGTWYLMCHHAVTKNAGKGAFIQRGHGPLRARV